VGDRERERVEGSGGRAGEAPARRGGNGGAGERGGGGRGRGARPWKLLCRPPATTCMHIRGIDILLYIHTGYIYTYTYIKGIYSYIYKGIYVPIYMHAEYIYLYIGIYIYIGIYRYLYIYCGIYMEATTGDLPLSSLSPSPRPLLSLTPV
jgi:hypothetical protein